MNTHEKYWPGRIEDIREFLDLAEARQKLADLGGWDDLEIEKVLGMAGYVYYMVSAIDVLSRRVLLCWDGNLRTVDGELAQAQTPGEHRELPWCQYPGCENRRRELETCANSDGRLACAWHRTYRDDVFVCKMCDEEEAQRKSVDVLQASRPAGQAGTPSMKTPERTVPEKSPVKPPTTPKKRRVLSQWEHERNQAKWLSDKHNREEEAAFRQWVIETGARIYPCLHGSDQARGEFERSGRSPRANRVAAIEAEIADERARIAAAQPWWQKYAPGNIVLYMALAGGAIMALAAATEVIGAVGLPVAILAVVILAWLLWPTTQKAEAQAGREAAVRAQVQREEAVRAQIRRERAEAAEARREAREAAEAAEAREAAKAAETARAQAAELYVLDAILAEMDRMRDPAPTWECPVHHKFIVRISSPQIAYRACPDCGLYEKV